ncbi:MAG: glutathione S-transferase, partial [Microcystaceae cyanobacterium]
TYVNLPKELRGKGIPGLADNTAYAPFFEWRDRLYQDFRQASVSPTPSEDNRPTPITID